MFDCLAVIEQIWTKNLYPGVVHSLYNWSYNSNRRPIGTMGWNRHGVREAIR